MLLVMKKWVSPISHLLVFSALVVSASQTYANHAAGMDITWACNPNNPCELTFTLRFYRDCGQPSGPSTAPFGAAANIGLYGVAGCTASPVMITPWTFSSPVDITPLCPSYTSTCDPGFGNFPGVEQFTGTSTYDFCQNGPPCPRYEIYWGTGARSLNITNVTNSLHGLGTHSGLSIDTQQCNSSPVFNSPPAVWICNSQPNTFSQRATDPDGNTLQYALIPCYGGYQMPLAYAAGYTPAQPLGANWTTTLNPNTGELTFTPTPGGLLTAVVCTQVSELDSSGNVIGQVVRDLQVRVINCQNNLPTLSGPYVYDLCSGQQFCFSTQSNDLDASHQLTLSVISNQTGIPLTIHPGQFPIADGCWTPTTPGTYTLVLQVKDNACPTFGMQQLTFIFRVDPCDPCDVFSAHFSASSNLGSPCTYTFWNNSSPASVSSQWDFGDGSPLVTGNPVMHGFSPGTYQVTLHATYVLPGQPAITCTDSYAQTIQAICKGRGPRGRTSQTKDFSAHYDSQLDQLQLMIPTSHHGTVCHAGLFDMSGKLLLELDFASEVSPPIDCSAYAQGMYFVRLTSDVGMQVIKFVKR